MAVFHTAKMSKNKNHTAGSRQQDVEDKDEEGCVKGRRRINPEEAKNQHCRPFSDSQVHKAEGKNGLQAKNYRNAPEHHARHGTPASDEDVELSKKNQVEKNRPSCSPGPKDSRGLLDQFPDPPYPPLPRHCYGLTSYQNQEHQDYRQEDQTKCCLRENDP